MADSSIQKFTKLLYDIYLKTSEYKDISENNRLVTQQFLRFSKDEETCVKFEEPTRRYPVASVCKCKNLPSSAEDILVDKIQKVVERAKAIRLESSPNVKSNNTQSPYKKSKPPKVITGKTTAKKTTICKTQSDKSISSQTCTKKRPKVSGKLSTNNPKENFESKSGRSIIARSKLNEITEILKTLDRPHASKVSHSSMRLECEQTNPLMAIPRDIEASGGIHNSDCPLTNTKLLPGNKSNTSLLSQKSNVRTLPMTLTEIRLPSDMQKLLKLYYRLIGEKDTGQTVKRTKLKNNFLTKLTLINTHRWRVFQGNEDSIPFQLQKYITSFHSVTMVAPMRPILCKYYDNVKILMRIQQSSTDRERMNIFKEIFKFMNTDFLRFVQSAECEKRLIPTIYKCISNILHMYDYGNFRNAVVYNQ